MKEFAEKQVEWRRIEMPAPVIDAERQQREWIEHRFDLRRLK